MAFKTSYGKTSTTYDGPYEGGQLVHLGTDGKFEVEILPGWKCQASAKNAAHAYFEGAVKIIDADHAGKVIPNARVMFLGMDKNQVDFIEKTNDLLISCGLETVETIKAKKAANVEADSDDIERRITGRRAYVMVTTELTNRGNPRSVVSSFITKDNYDKSVALVTHRWAPKATQAAPVTNGAAAPAPFNAGGGGAAAPTAF